MNVDFLGVDLARNGPGKLAFLVNDLKMAVEKLVADTS